VTCVLVSAYRSRDYPSVFTYQGSPLPATPSCLSQAYGSHDRNTWSAGGDLTQFDANIYALARAAEEIAHTYTDEVPPPDNLFIFSNSASALQAIKNPRSIKAHSSALQFHRVLTIFTLCHSHVSFYLIWSPADGDLEGFWMASTWAAAACLHDPPNGLDHVQSAAFQKDRAHAQAFLNWEIDFHRDRCISDFRAAVTGHPTNRHAHTHVILEGLSTHHHPLWSAAVVTFFLLTTVHITDYHWDRRFTSSSTPITHRL
jgi:hypothetical protein